MTIALTGATGFLGRHITRELAGTGNALRCWYRPASDRGGFGGFGSEIDWVPGDLGEPDAADALVAGCDAVVHAALWHPGGGFRGGEGDLLTFAERNVLGTLRLIEAAREVGVPRFVSTCAVHEEILEDRPLDEDHPTRPKSHYGAHKAAVEQFVHSHGLGDGYDICALRPTGIYGVARPVEDSKWYDLVRRVVAGEPVEATGGGKEVHAADVAGAVATLLAADADEICGRSFNCYDRYVSKFEVATLAAELAGTSPRIDGEPSAPEHQIHTDRLRSLGATFGGDDRLRETVAALVAAASEA